MSVNVQNDFHALVYEDVDDLAKLVSNNSCIVVVILDMKEEAACLLGISLPRALVARTAVSSNEKDNHVAHFLL